jgi:ribosomal-protein-alanine N-acetyltransferase
MDKGRVLDTPRLRLAPLDCIHAAGPYLQWMNDPEVVRWLEVRGKSFTTADLADFIESQNANPLVHMFGMFRRNDGRHIGNIKIGPLETRHGRGDIGLLIGDRGSWGKGYAREAIAAMADYALGPLGLHKVTAGCYAGNEGSRRAFLAAGFVQEGTRRAQLWDGERWDDEYLFARFAT